MSRAPGLDHDTSGVRADLDQVIVDRPDLFAASRWEGDDLPVRELVAVLGEAGIIDVCRGEDRPRALWNSVALHTRLASVGNGAAGGAVLSHVDVTLRMLDGLATAPDGLTDAMARGRALVALAVTEQAAGSDLASLTTKIDRGPDGVRVTGEKCFISNAAHADHVLVLAEDPAGVTGNRPGQALVMVDRGPGVTVDPVPMAGHPGLTATVRLDSAPVAHTVIPSGRAMLILTRHLIHERVMVSVRMAALARAVLDHAAAEATRTRTFDTRLIDNQHVQFTLAELSAAVLRVDAASRHGVRLLAAGRCPAPYAAACKYQASRTLRAVADAAVQLAGGAGYQLGHPAERALRDSAGLALAGGTEELMLIQVDRGEQR